MVYILIIKERRSYGEYDTDSITYIGGVFSTKEDAEKAFETYSRNEDLFWYSSDDCSYGEYERYCKIVETKLDETMNTLVSL